MQQIDFYYIFAAGYSFAALLHLIGLVLLCIVKTSFVNQRMITIHLAVTEILNCLFQVSVCVNALVKSRMYEMYLVLQFFIIFCGTSSKIIMMYLTMDRLLDIALHLKYAIYFTKRVVMGILSTIWLLSFTLGIIFTLLQLNVRNVIVRKSLYETRNYLFFTLDLFITVNAIFTYVCLYFKVKTALRNTPGGQSGGGQNPLAKFVVPCVLILTYVIFNVTGSLLKMFYFWNRKQTMFVNVSGLLVMFGWISDACVYIFAQREVRLYLISLFNKPVPQISLSKRTTQTDTMVGNSSVQFNHSNRDQVEDRNDEGSVKKSQPLSSKDMTVPAVDNLGYVGEVPRVCVND